MNRDPSALDAFVGAFVFLLLGVVAPLGINLGGVNIGLWMLPLVAVHLWPRDAQVGLSSLFLLALGTALDMALGLRLGTYPILALTWFALTRPDLREDELRELTTWLLFGLGIALTLGLIAVVNRSIQTALDLAPDAAVAVLAFPLVLRALRGLGRRDLAGVES